MGKVSMSLEERMQQSLLFDLDSFDTPERRQRIIEDVKRAIGEEKFVGPRFIHLDGKPFVSAMWKKEKLVVEILKAKPRGKKDTSVSLLIMDTKGL